MASNFATEMLGSPVPGRIEDEIVFPRRERFHASPADWRDEVLYFLLVDRFSDGQEGSRPLLDRRQLAAARPNGADGRA